VETPHPQGGWTMAYRVPDSGAFKLKETMDAESMLLGRITYEGFVAAWPKMSDVFADKMNAMPKHVVTNTLTELEWNATPLSGDIVAGVTKLKMAMAVQFWCTAVRPSFDSCSPSISSTSCT
jgi:dihydrofolate reductase